MTIYQGRCPATAGELIQGFLGNRELLVSYCIPLYSTATLQYLDSDLSLDFQWKKAEKVKDMTLRFLGIEDDKRRNLHLSIKRDIPIGKGMSSSTADLGAVMGACFAFAGEKPDPNWMARTAAMIEATDASFLSDCVIFDSLSGEVKTVLGKLHGCKVLILEPKQSLDTMNWRNTKNYREFKMQWQEPMIEIWTVLQKAFKQHDWETVGKCATRNSRMNQTLLPKPFLEEVIEIAEQNHAFGVNIAHSGTIIGILMAQSLDTVSLRKSLEEHGILNYYGRQYEFPIISGGITVERSIK